MPHILDYAGLASHYHIIRPCLAVRVFEEANLEEKSAEQLYERPRQPPRLAAESANSFKVELTEMKRILDEQGTKLPADRFDDSNAELLRFAASAGLLQVRCQRESDIPFEILQNCRKCVEMLRILSFACSWRPQRSHKIQKILLDVGHECRGKGACHPRRGAACAENPGLAQEAPIHAPGPTQGVATHGKLSSLNTPSFVSPKIL